MLINDDVEITSSNGSLTLNDVYGMGGRLQFGPNNSCSIEGDNSNIHFNTYGCQIFSIDSIQLTSTVNICAPSFNGFSIDQLNSDIIDLDHEITVLKNQLASIPKFSIGDVYYDYSTAIGYTYDGKQWNPIITKPTTLPTPVVPGPGSKRSPIPHNQSSSQPQSNSKKDKKDAYDKAMGII